MKPSFSLEGIFSAQWIPFGLAGVLDRERLAEHLDFERRQGVAGVLALGSTGEFPRFSLDERKTVLAAVAELAAPLPVIANITDIRPDAAIALGRFARELGLPAVALMPPYFFPVSAADMLAHFLRVAEAVDLPVLLYNFPELTGNRIALSTVAAFADRAPMIGIKQSGAEFAYHHELVALGREKGFAVMSGADTRLPEAFAIGAAGCIGGLVNIVPDVMVELYRARGAGDLDRMIEPARRLAAVGAILDRLTFPLNVAAGLEARGFDPGEPKAVVSEESRRIYEGIVLQLGTLFSDWNLEPALETIRPA